MSCSPETDPLETRSLVFVFLFQEPGLSIPRCQRQDTSLAALWKTHHPFATLYNWSATVGRAHPPHSHRQGNALLTFGFLDALFLILSVQPTPGFLHWIFHLPTNKLVFIINSQSKHGVLWPSEAMHFINRLCATHFLSFLEVYQSNFILKLKETAKENGMELFRVFWRLNYFWSVYLVSWDLQFLFYGSVIGIQPKVEALNIFLKTVL